MVKLLLKCPECKKYSMDKIALGNQDDSEFQKCPNCGERLVTPHPPRFSMENKYLKYIREMKKLF